MAVIDQVEKGLIRIHWTQSLLIGTAGRHLETEEQFDKDGVATLIQTVIDLQPQVPVSG